VTRSWLRNLGGKVFPKAHFIDALAVTTSHLVKRHGEYEKALREISMAIKCACSGECKCGIETKSFDGIQKIAREALKQFNR
jgi:hypothetical protein